MQENLRLCATGRAVNVKLGSALEPLPEEPKLALDER